MLMLIILDLFILWPIDEERKWSGRTVDWVGLDWIGFLLPQKAKSSLSVATREHNRQFPRRFRNAHSFLSSLSSRIPRPIKNFVA
jgi:hypothetical protein